MSISYTALLAAHELCGHCIVSDGVRGIQCDQDGFTVLCDAPMTESQFISQMIAGSLAELILINGVEIALLKLRADKSVLNTEIGEFDWAIVKQIPHDMVIAAAERIAPMIASALARFGKKGLLAIGEKLNVMESGEVFALEGATNA